MLMHTEFFSNLSGLGLVLGLTLSGLGFGLGLMPRWPR